MTDGDQKRVTCNRCDEPVRLVAHEDTKPIDYSLECGCDFTRLDVSDCVNGNNLLDPIAGRWSMLNDNEYDA